MIISHVREVEFMPVGEEWPSMCYHKELKLLLVIYVDDLKLAGPSQNLTKGRKLLRSQLRIEPESDLGLYLGCLLSKGTNRLHDGTEVTTLTCNMEGLLKLSVDKYVELAGKDAKLKQVSTPSPPEETKQHKSRAPPPGDPKQACSSMSLVILDCRLPYSPMPLILGRNPFKSNKVDLPLMLLAF